MALLAEEYSLAISSDPAEAKVPAASNLERAEAMAWLYADVTEASSFSWTGCGVPWIWADRMDNACEYWSSARDTAAE